MAHYVGTPTEIADGEAEVCSCLELHLPTDEVVPTEVAPTEVSSIAADADPTVLRPPEPWIFTLGRRCVWAETWLTHCLSGWGPVRHLPPH